MTFTCPVSGKASKWVNVAAAARVLQVPEASIHRRVYKGFLMKREFYDLVSRRDVVDLAAKLTYSQAGRACDGEPTDEEIKRLTGNRNQDGACTS